MTSLTSALLVDSSSQAGRPSVLSAEVDYDAPSWAREHRHDLRRLVAEHGSLMVRGLGLRTASEVAAVARQLAGEPMVEREAFAARQAHADGVYGSSAWPANQPMCMHHERSYAMRFPGLMMFGCLAAPQEGGATAVADAAVVLDALPVELVERFEREGWLLTRNYNDDIGVSYAEAFGTEDRAAIEDYCRANAIAWEWLDEGGLRTRQRRSAIVRHPVTGQRCWFNQIAFLNEWTIDEEVREFLIDVYGEDGLPFTTHFGGGDPITKDVVEVIGQVYQDNTRREPWVAGDLLVVDNIRSAHSREAFTGPREVIVAMADALMRPDDMSPMVKDATK